jgi:hypothetical protein
MDVRATSAAAILALVFAASGCLGMTDSRPATWSFVSAAILEPNCASASCHSRGAAAAGLDLSSAERGFISLTGLWVWIVDPAGTADQGCRAVDGTTVCQREHRSLVVPFDPAQSRLTQLLRARQRNRMPPDRPLPEVDIRLIETWILDGAIDDRAVAVAGEGGGGGESAAVAPAATVHLQVPPDAQAPGD